MKLREKMKRFWTLDVHNHEGFTLVELIIVIAILAILSTGAIAGYSAYIESANRTVDESLAAEIENALILAYYNGILKPGASVVVYYGDNDAYVHADAQGNDFGANQAMVDAFGENWKEALRLQWAGWKDEMGVAADSTMMGYVENSNFNADNLDSLLSQVQAVVNAANGAMAGMVVDPDSIIADCLDKAGLELDADGKIKAEDAGAAANALVFSVADDITKANLDQDAFVDGWYDYIWGGSSGFVDNLGMDSVSAAAAEYAAALSLAQYIDGKTAGTADATNFASRLENHGATNIVTNKDALLGEMGDFMGSRDALIEDFENSAQYKNDAMAFLAYMSGVSSSSDSLIENEGLAGDNYFTNGNVLSYVQDYVAIGNALVGANADNGAFVFVFNGETVSCLPLDY